MNLWGALMGESVDPPPMPKGSPILCTCGRRVGVEALDGDLWSAEYQHTPAGSADVVFQIMLEDVETLATMEQRGELDDRSPEIAATLTKFAALANRDTSGDLSPLAAVLPRLVVPPRTYPRAALDLDATRERPRAILGAAVPAGCKKCRVVYDAREVLAVGARNKRGALLVSGCEPASIARLGYTAPESGVLPRVALYQRLNVMLSFEHSASLVGEVSPVK